MPDKKRRRHQGVELERNRVMQKENIRVRRKYAGRKKLDQTSSREEHAKLLFSV